MRIRQKVALLMTCVMTMNLMPIDVKANVQNHVSKLQLNDTDIGHTADGTDLGAIRPTVEMKWEKPEIAPPTEEDGENNAPHDVEFYQVQLSDYSVLQNGFDPSVTASEVIEKEVTQQDLGELSYGYSLAGDLSDQAIQLKNGTLYKAELYPFHTHTKTVIVDGEEVTERFIAPHGPGAPASSYFITDFDTQVEAKDTGLEVSWEYMPGADYEITYVPANKGTKEEINNGDIKPQVHTVTDSEAQKYMTTGEDGRVWVKYPLKDLQAKQIYSMYVEVVSFSTNYTDVRFDQVKRNKTTPKVVQGVPNINITVNSIGKDLIEIYWGSIDWAELGNGLKSVIVEAREENGSFKYVAQMNAVTGGKLDSIIIDEPKNPTYYRVRFVFDGSTDTPGSTGEDFEIVSTEALYTPEGLRIQPANPSIPKPYGENVALTPATKNDYLVSGDNRPFDENFLASTFHGGLTPAPFIQLVWDAPLIDGEVDYELYYDVWVSDDLDLLIGETQIEPLFKDLQITEGMTTNHITDYNNTNKVIGMKFNITEYLDSAAMTQSLKSNNSYYIKMIAKRKYDETEEKSVATIVSIGIDKNGNISQPPIIGKPPLRLKNEAVETTSLTVEWLTKWYEIIAKDISAYSGIERILAEVGSPQVYTPPTTTQPMLRFNYVDEAFDEHKLYKNTDVEQVQQRIDQIFGAGKYDANYFDRMIVLDEEVKYEFAIEPYNDIEARFAEEQTIEDWVANDANDDTALNWEAFEPTVGQKDEEGLQWTEHKIDGLVPNTKYVIMLRAYRELEDGTVLTQAFPSYVIGTTETNYVAPEAIPTVPNLFVKPDSETDTSFTVYWKYNKNFTYELVYSKEDNPETAEPVPFEISDDPEHPSYIPDGENVEVTIYGLFPETTYNVWVRAKQRIGTAQSAFSTPATATTKPLQAPQIPTGLGQAAYQSLLENGQDIKPVEKDYITVEWNKDPSDEGVQEEGTMRRTYEYDLQLAEEVEFLEYTEITVTEELTTEEPHEIIAKNIVKWNELTANRPYYVKIRARVILEDTATGQILQSESEYSKWVRIFTAKTDDEYDGGDSDHVVTYPDKFEESYDDGVWEWEILDSHAVISEIIDSEDYYYTIDMDLYRGEDVQIRRIKIPVNVVEALVGESKELKVVTHQATYEIPAQSIDYMTEGMAASDKVQMDFETLLAYDMKDFEKAYPYEVESAEAFSLTTKSVGKQDKEMMRLDGMMKVKMKLEDASDYQKNTFKTYTYTPHFGEWTPETYQIETDQDATYMSYSTSRVGINTLYRIDTYTQGNEINYAMQEILDQYNINDFGTRYEDNDLIDSTRYTQLILGIAQDYTDITLSDTLTPQQVKMAEAIAIDVDGPYVTQEEAIHGIVKLYEMQTGYRVQPSNKNFEDVSPKYQDSVAKAYALGLIEEVEAENVTYGDLSEWLLQVIQ